MYKALAIFVVVIWYEGYSQPGETSFQIQTRSDSTGFGLAEGKLVSKTIGPAGDSIASEDRKLTLIFPPGALTNNTIISIQPTVNLAPNGAGKAYLFEPSGIRFNKPVEIIFQYTEEEAEICPPDLMALAMQDQNGKWKSLEYEDHDSVSRELRGWIQHFSRYSNIYMLRIEPEKQRIRVKESTNIRIWEAFKKSNIMIEASFHSKQPILWFVNGIENGNGFEGLLTITEATYKLLGSMETQAKYTAPESFPGINPVIIRVDVYVHSGIKKDYHRKRSLRCRIAVYDSYEVIGVGIWDNTTAGGGGLLTRFVDTGSIRFEISTITSFVKGVGNMLAFGELSIHNNLMVLEKMIVPPRCEAVYMNKDYCTGPIHIIGIDNITLSNSSVGPRIAIVQFKPARGLSPLFKVTCAGRTNFTPAMQLTAYPNMVKFELRDGEQGFDFGTQGTLIKAKAIIRRISE